MEVLFEQGEGGIATVYVARLADGERIEFAESCAPGIPRSRKWVLIVSTLKGCPVRCPICDAGGNYKGRLSATEILDQVTYMVERRFGRGAVPVEKLKVQFARMGDPAFNDSVLEVIEALPEKLDAPGLMPCISTVAPAGRDGFFERLLDLKRQLYRGGRYQMQLSIHTTDEEQRRKLVPARTWSFAQMGDWGKRYFAPGDRKVTLNFAPARGFPLEPEALLEFFDPEAFAVKLTPINPTGAATASGLSGLIDPSDPTGCREVCHRFESAGYQTILSIGEMQENTIGSNCGMFLGLSQRA